MVAGVVAANTDTDTPDLHNNNSMGCTVSTCSHMSNNTTRHTAQLSSKACYLELQAEQPILTCSFNTHLRKQLDSLAVQPRTVVIGV